MLYLFCDRSYGGPFLKAAARFADRTGARITAVFSAAHRRRRLESRFHDFLERLTPNGLPSLIVADVRAEAFWRLLRPGDSGIIAGFNQIFGPEAIARLNPFVNFHPSLLPLYRGPVPAYWCIVNGEQMTGFTLHVVTGKIDDGEILYQEAVPIDGITDPDLLTANIAARAAPILDLWLNHVVKGEPWVPVRLNAAVIYKHHVPYATFPAK